MLAALLLLPTRTRVHVLSACLRTHTLGALLTTLPPALHPPLLSAAVASGTLTIPPKVTTAFLTQLAHTPIPAPGLQSLTISDAATADDFPTATAALLVHAASAHPSLTSLHLHRPILPSDWVHTLSLSLTRVSLPSLSHLSISSQFHPDSCARVAACLKHLPALTSLKLHLQSSPVLPSGTQVAISAACMWAATAPAFLPSLQSLTFHELKTRTQATPAASFLHSFLPLIVAPELTGLEFLSHANLISHDTLLPALSTYPALRELHINAQANSYFPPFPGDAHMARQAGSAKGSRTGHSVFADECMHGLESLSVLCVTSVCPALSMQAATRVTARACEGLTRVCLERCPSQQRGDGYDGSLMVSNAWMQLLPVLSRCAALQHLELKALQRDGSTAMHDVQAYSAQLGQTLRALPMLTHLTLEATSVNGGRCVLSGRDIEDGVQGMEGLQELQLLGGTGGLEFDDPQVVVDTCCALPRLQVLGLAVRGVSAAEVQLVLKCATSLSRLLLRKELIDEVTADPAGAVSTGAPPEGVTAVKITCV